MPQPYQNSALQHFYIDSLVGGLITATHPKALPPGAAQSMSNVWDNYGYLTPRPGLVPQAYTLTGHDADNVFASGHALYTAPANAFVDILTVRSAEIVEPFQGNYSLSGQYFVRSPFITVDATPTITPTVNPGIPQEYDAVNPNCESVVFKSAVYSTFWWGQHLVSYNGVSGVVDTLDNIQPDPDLLPPAGPKHICATPSRLFLANFRDYAAEYRPTLVMWSDFLLPHVWNGPTQKAGSSGQQDLFDTPGPVTAITAVGTDVVAFKDDYIYVGSPGVTASAYTFRMVISGVGCIDARSLKHWKSGMLIWAGRDNIYMGNVGQPPQPLSAAIQNRVLSAAGSFRGPAVIDYVRGYYHIFLRSLTAGPSTGTSIFSCNLQTGAWYEGFTTQAITTCEQAEQDIYTGVTRRPIYAYGSVAGLPTRHLFDPDVRTDVSVAFSCAWRSGMFSFADITQKQSQQACVEKLRVFSDATTGSVTLSLVHSSGWDRPSTTSFGTQSFSNTTAPDLFLTTKATAEVIALNIAGTSTTFPQLAAACISMIPRGDTGWKA